MHRRGHLRHVALSFGCLLVVGCSSDCGEGRSGDHASGSAADAGIQGDDALPDGSPADAVADTVLSEVDAIAGSDVPSTKDASFGGKPDVPAEPPPDGVCPSPDPAAPRPGDPCDSVGASRCSETGMGAVDTLEKTDLGMSEYACVRPNRLVCTQTESGLVWQDVACPVPPESCAPNQVVTCVDDGAGTRCCPLRCRNRPGWAGAGDSKNGTLLCSDTGQILCRAYPWMRSDWVYACGLIEDTPFAEGHSDCLPWCGGCTYYFPATKCGSIPVCNCSDGGVPTLCETNEDGLGQCPDLSQTDCVWRDDCPYD